MLAGLNFRGNRPKDAEAWKLIYDTDGKSKLKAWSIKGYKKTLNRLELPGNAMVGSSTNNDTCHASDGIPNQRRVAKTPGFHHPL